MPKAKAEKKRESVQPEKFSQVPPPTPNPYSAHTRKRAENATSRGSPGMISWAQKSRTSKRQRRLMSVPLCNLWALFERACVRGRHKQKREEAKTQLLRQQQRNVGRKEKFADLWRSGGSKQRSGSTPLISLSSS